MIPHPPPDADLLQPRALTVPAESAGCRLDAWLAQTLAGLSRSRIQGLIAAGHATVDGHAAKASASLVAGQTVCLTIPPSGPATPRPEAIALDIVFEDASILVLDKSAGLVVHPAPGHADGTLVNALLHHCDDLGGIGGVERPGIVHRLDKETSGLMVVAKTDAAMAGLVAQFKSGGVRKVYLALVHGVPKKTAGLIDTLIGRHPRDRKRMAVVSRNGKQAITRYTVVRPCGDVSLIEACIETGRTHQIRVHLAHLGHPIVGDPLYGSRTRDQAIAGCPARQMLHAARLAFSHPVSREPLDFSRPPPPDMLALMDQLAGGSAQPEYSSKRQFTPRNG
ncbi:MAG: RluA family pseudouridine synthase [Lentisphaerae bacterium]|nr:RluA family pseudouridine synthase [Lentisphaerota bacterium]